MKETWIILYDADCGFCDWCRDVVEKYDHQQIFSFVDINEKQAIELARQANKTISLEHPESFVLYQPRTRDWLEKTQAIKHICKELSFPLSIIYYLLLFTPSVVSDWAYHMLALHRGRLSKFVGRQNCRIRS